MAKHTGEVGQEARAIFADVREIGKRVLERFYEGFELALKDVNKNWASLKPQEKKIVFEKVQDVAKEILVDVKDGGGATKGLALSTFYQYVCKVKRAILFRVGLHIAEKATNQELQKAQQHVTDSLKDVAGTHEDKMEQAYLWVKQEQVKEKERLREEFEKSGKCKSPSLNTHFTLPDPDDYQDSEELLNNGIEAILAWLQSKGMREHLQQPLPSAASLRRVLGELVVASPEKAVA